MLMFELALVFPWDTLRAGHVLTETESHPWVTLEILSKPVNVLDFHFAGGHWRQLFNEYFVGFSARLPHLFVRFVIEDGLSEPTIVSIVVLARHTLSRLLLTLFIRKELIIIIIINILRLIY